MVNMVEISVKQIGETREFPVEKSRAVAGKNDP